MTTASNWLFNWFLSFIVPYLLGANYANLGSKVFFIWGGFCWISVVFVFFMIYETKGLSLEQVNELYEICPKAWKSNEARKSLDSGAAAAAHKEMRMKEDERAEQDEKARESDEKAQTLEG